MAQPGLACLLLGLLNLVVFSVYINILFESYLWIHCNLFQS